MKVSAINPISFRAKIIDAHAHIGKHEGVIYEKSGLDVFTKTPLPNSDNVVTMLVSSLDVIHSEKSELVGNRALLSEISSCPQYRAFAACSPRDGNVANIKTLFKENPNVFIGLKFHPSVQNLPLNDPKYIPYLNFASKHNIPCLFHTAVDVDNQFGKLIQGTVNISDPAKVYELAKKYPKTPFVMAHMGAGWNEAHDKAIEVLVNSIKNGDANLYADISWVNIDHSKNHIIKAIKSLKGVGQEGWEFGDQSFRLIFGTDAPLDRFSSNEAREIYSKYIEDIKAAIRNDVDLKSEAEAIIDNLFHNNAQKLYLQAKDKKIHSSKVLIAMSIPLLALLTSGIIYLNKRMKQHNSKLNK